MIKFIFLGFVLVHGLAMSSDHLAAASRAARKQASVVQHPLKLAATVNRPRVDNLPGKGLDAGGEVKDQRDQRRQELRAALLAKRADALNQNGNLPKEDNKRLTPTERNALRQQLRQQMLQSPPDRSLQNTGEVRTAPLPPK